MIDDEFISKYYFENDFSKFESYIKAVGRLQRSYSPGDIISSQADTLNKGYYILDGIMKVSIGITDKNEKTIALFGPGSIFPLGVNEHHYTLEYAIVENALTKVDALEFSFWDIRRMVQENSELRLRMLEHYCDFTSFLFYEIASLSSSSVSTKIISILCSLATSSMFANKKISLSQSEIATLAGSSKIQIARAYRVLKEKGLIEVHRNSITIRDLKKLQQFDDFSEL